MLQNPPRRAPFASQLAIYGTLLAVVLLAPALGAYPVFVLKVLCFALFACAFNLLIGYTGLLSFGHAAFFGGAGYVAGHAMKAWGLTPELGLLLGTAFAALTGLAMGALAIRRQGIYFSMITLALAQMLFFFCLQAPFTGGEDGIQGIPRGKLLGLLPLDNDLTLYYVVLAIVVAAFALIVRTIHSPFGQILKAIKENEPRAVSLGYDVDRFKLLAFVLSAALSGLAGSLKALVLVIALENKLGDLGTFLARATGVAWFDTLGESVTMVTGVIFVICVLTFRRGIVGEIIGLAAQYRPPRKPAAPAGSHLVDGG